MSFNWAQFDEKWAAGLVVFGAIIVLMGLANLPVYFTRSRDDGFDDDEDRTVLSLRGALLLGTAMVVIGIVIFAMRAST